MSARRAAAFGVCDGGTTYKPGFRQATVQSIGAIAIDPQAPKTVWVGTGESWTRNSVSVGDGILSRPRGENWRPWACAIPSASQICRSERRHIVYALRAGKVVER